MYYVFVKRLHLCGRIVNILNVINTDANHLNLINYIFTYKICTVPCDLKMIKDT